MQDLDWTEQAACAPVVAAGYDPWFSPYQSVQKDAVAICRTCPVQRECANEVRRLKKQGLSVYGVWAGKIYSPLKLWNRDSLSIMQWGDRVPGDSLVVPGIRLPHRDNGLDLSKDQSLIRPRQVRALVKDRCKSWTLAERRVAVAILYHAGMSISKIAERFRVSRRSIDRDIQLAIEASAPITQKGEEK